MSYGGCEVMAIPNLIFRRRYVVYCRAQEGRMAVYYERFVTVQMTEKGTKMVNTPRITGSTAPMVVRSSRA